MRIRQFYSRVVILILLACLELATVSSGPRNCVFAFTPVQNDLLDHLRLQRSASPETDQSNGTFYVDGVHYSTAGTALAACPATGCVIDMRGNSSPRALNLAYFDPGASKPVTLLLGPYTYHVNTITLESNLHIVGAGGATVLQSVSETNDPVFVLPQSNNTAASNVLLRNFQVIGAPGNTAQDGFDLDCSRSTGNGLFYSLIEGITVQRFNGVSIRLRGPNNNFSSNNQLTTFQNIFVFRGSSAKSGEALRIEGANSNLTFTECQFDGAADLGTNIYLGVLKGGTDGYPISIHFHGTISQNADIAVAINGSVNIDFHDSHHEHIKTGGYRITGGTFNLSILIDRTYFAADGSYNNEGKGYLVNSASGSVQNDIIFTNNVFGQFGKAPDNVLLGNAQWTTCGNLGASAMFQPCQFKGQTLQSVNFQANEGMAQKAENISLGAGWGAGAKITEVKGWTQTEQFTIHSGSSGFSPAPTITMTFPNPFSQTPICDLTVQAVTGPGGPLLFNPDVVNRTSAKFIAETPSGAGFVPSANETYKVLMRCGP
jgi:hypothetical protein